MVRNNYSIIGLSLISVILISGGLFASSSDSNQIDDSVQDFSFGIVQLSSATHVFSDDDSGTVDIVLDDVITNLDGLLNVGATITAGSDELQSGKIRVEFRPDGDAAGTQLTAIEEESFAGIAAGDSRSLVGNLDINGTVPDGDYDIVAMYFDDPSLSGATSVDYDVHDFTVDRTKPTVTTSVNAELIALANETAAEQFVVTATFDEAMDTGFTPNISFKTASDGTGTDETASLVGSSLQFSSGAWSAGDTVYTATYNVLDGDDEFANLFAITSDAQDLATNSQNTDASTATDRDFKVDTREPTAIVTLSDAGIDGIVNDADDNGSFTVNVAYDEPMDEDNSSPTVTFSNSTIISSGTLSETKAEWSTTLANTYVVTYSVTDLDHDIDSLTADADGATDAAGNDDIADSSDSFEVDMDNPEVSSISVSDSLLSDSDDNGTPFTVTAIFDEPMTISDNPTVTFNVTSLESPPQTLTLDSGTWSDSSTFVASYTVTDLGNDGVDADSVTATITGGSDANGNAHEPDGIKNVKEDAFEVDMRNPLVISGATVSVNATLINSQNVTDGSTLAVTVDYDEPMIADNSENPTITFTPDVTSTLGANPTTEEWLDSDTFRAVYTLSDNEVYEPVVDIASIVGAKDLATNVQVDYTDGITDGPFVIDTQDPSLVVPDEVRREGDDTANPVPISFSVNSDDIDNPTSTSVVCWNATQTFSTGMAGVGPDVNDDFAFTEVFSFDPGTDLMTCKATDENENTTQDTFDSIISEILGVEIQNLTPFWDETITVNGTAFGFKAGEIINVTNGLDPSDSFDEVVILEEADSSAGFFFETQHAFSSVTSDTNQTITVELVSNPVQATAAPLDEVSVQKHPVEFQNNDQQDVFWGDPVAKNGTLFDTFAGTGVTLTSTINLRGDGLDADSDGVHDLPLTNTTNANGFFTFNGVSPIIAKQLNMTANFTTNQFYESASSEDVDTWENLKHPTAFQDVSLMPDGQPWGTPATKSANLVDTHLSVGLADAEIDLGGDGLGNIDTFTITNATGGFKLEGTTITRTAIDVDAVLMYFGDDLYEPAPDHVDTYSTTSHDTTLTLGEIEDVKAGEVITIVGKLTDNNAGDATVANKEITFTVEQGTSFAVDDVLTPGPLTVLGQDLTVSGGNLQLDAGDAVVFDSEPIFALFSVEESDSELSILITGTDDSESTGTLKFSSDPISVHHSAGIESIEVISASNGALPISQIEERNAQDNTVSTFTFTDTATPTNFLQFDGQFVSGGVTNIEDELNIQIKAQFAGDADYNDSNTLSNLFDTTLDSETLLGASATGVSSVILPDPGVGIISKPCLAGDTDKDALCDEWESDFDLVSNPVQASVGIPFDVDGQTVFYPLPGTSVNQKDLLVEIDAMPPHLPSNTVLQNVTDVFASFPNGNDVNMINDISDQDIPHLDFLSVWKDNDNVFGNDFNSLKSIYFGDSDERVTVSGTQTNEFKNERMIQSFDGDLIDESGNSNTGTKVGTPSFVSGQINQAMQFNGADQYVTFPDNTFNGEGEGTVAAWINPDTVHSSVIFGAADNANSLGLWRFGTFADGSDLKLIVQTRSPDNNVILTTNTIPLNTWTHVALTGSGNIADPWRIYINGEEQTNLEIFRGANEARWWDSQQLSGDLIYTAAAWVRSTGTIEFFDGAIDDLRIYNFELSGPQVTNLYNTGSIANPVALYELNNDVIDGTANNIDGIVTGTTTFVTGQKAQSFDFDGSSKIEFTDNSFNSQSNGTVAAWINPDTVHSSAIFGVADSSSSVGLWRFGTFADGSDLKLIVQTRSPDNNVILTTNTIPLNTWTHVALTGSGNIADPWRVYINGVEQTDLEIFRGANEARWWDTQQLSGDLRYDMGAWDRSTGTIQFFNGQIDDLRVYDTILNANQLKKLMDTSTDKINSLITVSGVTLDTPTSPLTSGATEGTIDLRLRVSTSDATALNEDRFRDGKVTGGDSAISFGVPDVFSFGNTGDKVLRIKVPYTVSSDVDDAVVGTVEIPVVSEAPITAVSTDLGSPDVSSSLLEARAQAYRYVLFAHSIGGSSGQAELLGNDAVVAMGEGFEENDDTHAGTEGSDQEIAGTYLHEVGHLLNLQHGGPRTLVSDPDTTLISTSFNCVPIQRSVMSYTGQTPAFLGDNWLLQLNPWDAALSETGLIESDGIALPTNPLIIYATPKVADAFSTGIADGTALDLDGNGAVSESPADFDLNDFGIAGCGASPDQDYEVFEEAAHLNFNFRDTASGQFDGYGPVKIGENNGKINRQLFLEAADFIIDPPIDIDGTEFVNAGRTIPLHFELFKPDSTEKITDANAEAILVQDTGSLDSEGKPVLSFTKLGDFVFDGNKYKFDWDTDKSFSDTIVGVQYSIDTLALPGPDGEDGTADDIVIDKRVLVIPETINPTPLTIPTGTSVDDGGVEVTVQIRFK